MQPKAFHRKLTAILSADVAGYSRQMQGDEAATVTTLEAYKKAFCDLIKQHRGPGGRCYGNDCQDRLPRSGGWSFLCFERRNTRADAAV